jgi:hypothetical protein
MTTTIKGMEMALAPGSTAVITKASGNKESDMASELSNLEMGQFIMVNGLTILDMGLGS